MSYAPVARELARYNKWQNDGLIALLSGMTEEELSRDRNMFFGSLFATLDHILMVDRNLLAIIHDDPPESFDPRKRIAADFANWRDLREAEDARIIGIVDKADESWFDETVALPVRRLGITLERPRSIFWSQLFNHQTHHRSQVTSELQHMGVDYGVTDIPFNPLSPFAK